MKRRKGFYWDLVIALSFPLTFIFGFIWNLHIKAVGGAAFGGKIKDAVFYVKNDAEIYTAVSSFQWDVDFFLGCITLILGLVATFGLAYFPIKYFFIPFLGKSSQGKKL